MSTTDAEGGTLVGSVVVESAAGYAQTVRAGHHRLTADEPAGGGGTDTGPAPYSLLLAALGACTSITLRMYADRKGWGLGAVHVALRLILDGQAERIERELSFGAALTEEQRHRLLEIADKTPVTRTLRTGLPITTRVAAG